MAKVPDFEVISLTPLDAGALRGYATVRIANLITVAECRIIKNPGQPANVSLPAKSWIDDKGERRYSTLMQFHNRDWLAKLTLAVLSAWQEFPTGIRSVESIQHRPTAFRDKVRRRARLMEQK